MREDRDVRKYEFEIHPDRSISKYSCYQECQKEKDKNESSEESSEHKDGEIVKKGG